MIQLNHISKTFVSKGNEVHALKDVTLAIDEGEIFGIIGFSGAGKSTLIRCINLLEKPSLGEVIVDDQKLMEMDEKQLRKVRKKIGMIFQHFNLMQSRTVYQNIAFSLKDSTLSKVEKDKKIIALLELVDLLEKKDAYPSQLSGGQKQRVSIARALANDPKILLCDEATSALDPQTTKSILKLLKRVNAQFQITIVLITHEMSVVKEICDHVAIMEEGKIIEQGTILDIFANPKMETTKNFIATTSSISNVYEMMEKDSSLVNLQEEQWLVQLKYGQSSSEKALISEISRQFHVDTNIIFGNVEVLQGVGLGDLIVVLSGEGIAKENAVDYLEKHDVKVEVLKKC